MINASDLNCECTTKILTRRTFRNLSQHWCYQCITCGMHTKSMKQEEANCRIAAGELWEEFDEERSEKYRAMVSRRNQLDRLDEKDRRKADYFEYLQSDTWRAKRSAVLEREHGICQGCRSKTASQVHHLTYAHCGDELLFELVAVCKTCHEKAHGDQYGE